MNEVILDIETQNTFQEVGARDCRLLKISLLVVYFYKSNEYRVYFERDLPTLWKDLQFCDRVIGFNLKGFDYSVMNNYAPYDLYTLPTLDILEEVQKNLGFRISLDSIAQSSLGIGKSANGLDAVRFWKEGDLKSLEDYCKQDVRVTKDVYEYGVKHSKIFFDDKWTGQKKQVSVDFNFLKPKTNFTNLTLGL